MRCWLEMSNAYGSERRKTASLPAFQESLLILQLSLIKVMIHKLLFSHGNLQA